MTDNVFVDTNILVYARDLSDTFKNGIAVDQIEKLWDQRNGRISTQVLNEYFVTVTKKLSPGLNVSNAWADLESLSSWNPLPLDWKLIETSKSFFTEYSLSWWDSLIIGAANLTNSRILLSEDLAHGETYGVTTVVNPFKDPIN